MSQFAFCVAVLFFTAWSLAGFPFHRGGSF